MTVRDDLLHLSPEALTHAANAGIVKRAQRELAGGYRPALTLDGDDTLAATFADGIACSWPRGATIQTARCSCGAAGICRHRVIAALAYREEAAATAATPAVAAPVAQADDATLARVVPAALLAEAARLRDAGLSVELRHLASGEPCDTARLPSATVRFWGGAALEAARCDCVRAAACEHVALGLWAFRAAAQEEPSAARSVVRLGATGGRHALERAPFERLVAALLRHGVAHGHGAIAQDLSGARAAAAGAAWLELLLAELETWSEAYARRSALYDATQGVDLLAELGLRLAAGTLPGNAGAALGLGQAGETALDRLRLMCLGARTRRDGEARRTTLVLADLDTGTRLVLDHAWQVPDGSADEAALRASERLAPGVRLEQIAQGQLLAQQAARRPDGSVRLARARSAQNSVLPQSGDWSQLGSPVRFASVAALHAELRAHPNAALQPRHAARRFIVFTPAACEPPLYDAPGQCAAMVLRDADDAPLLLRRAHERHVPHALDALAAAATGRHGALRHAAGVLSWHGGLPVLEPWALACAERMLVPDFAAAEGALAAVPLGQAELGNEAPVARHLEALRQWLAALFHHGLARLPRGWPAEAAALAHRLDDAGLRELARRLASLVAALRDAPDAVALAAPLLELLGLRQLHQDAATLQ